VFVCVGGDQLLDGIKTLIKQALYLNTSRDELMQLLPGALDAPLKDLIATIIMHRMPEWRKQVRPLSRSDHSCNHRSLWCSLSLSYAHPRTIQIISSQISLPRLEEINWRVDVKSASDLIGQMSVPTVLVEMQVRPTQPLAPSCHLANEARMREQIRDGDLPPAKQVRKVQFELSKEGLQTVLEGLGKIRDQLSSTAAAAQ